MTYTLMLVFIMANGHVGETTTDFTSMQRCLIAQQDVTRQLKDNGARVVSQGCYRK